MIDAMGIFRTTIELTPWPDHAKRLVLRDVIVNTESAYTWLPRAQLEELGVTAVRGERFKTAEGRVVEREIGFALIFAGGRASPTIVVFAEEGDMVLLGAIALEGLNLRIDIISKELVPAGPIPVATAKAA